MFGHETQFLVLKSRVAVSIDSISIMYYYHVVIFLASHIYIHVLDTHIHNIYIHVLFIHIIHIYVYMYYSCKHTCLYHLLYE